MSYRVLARKWRPQTWDDLLAQEHVTRTLRNAIETGRLAHAYLFSGPRGVGKTSAARILAKALNCEHGPTSTPCNQCSACREISEGRNVDVFEIDGASNNGVDEVRNLRENVRYAPAQGKYKIYIIDEVHMLTVQAFNALLKTLEEPPENVLFIFATTEPHKIPPTIISRCQRFDFRRIPVKDIIQNLEHICIEEGIEIEKEALEIIALKGDGSMRDSQSLLDQMISYHNEKITAEHVIQGLGLIKRERYFELTNAILQKDTAKGFDIVEEIIRNGYDVGEFVSGLIEHFRNILIARDAGVKALVDVPESAKEDYKDAGTKFTEGDLFRLLKVVDELQQRMKRSSQKRVLFEMAVAKMIKMDSTVTIENLLSRLKGIPVNDADPKSISNQPQPASDVKKQASYSLNGNEDKSGIQQTDKPVNEEKKQDEKKSRDNSGEKRAGVKPSVSQEDVKAKWDDVVDSIKNKTITVGSFIQDGVITNVEDNVIEIAFQESNWFHIDAILRSRSVVDGVLADVFGTGVTFTCIKKDVTQDGAVMQPDAEKKKLSEMAKSNPVLKRIVDEFGADVVS
ncbi:DNA polymerase III subunit gamma/tau [bacterium]|nr:DNA polymerase III subunit gamma/tau [bacterium]